MSSNPSLTKAGLPPHSSTIGLWVQTIDRNGMVATGFLEHYNVETDTFDVLIFDRKAEVTQTTDQSASGRFGDFGGAQIQSVPVLRISGACYIRDPRAGVPRFILASEDVQQLIDWVNAVNSLGQSAPALPDTTGQPAGSQGTNEPAGSQPPAPEPIGKETPPEHPDIKPGEVVEPETPAIPAEQQKGKLPKDFPGRVALESFGITKFGQLKKLKNLQDVPGIGDATAAKIKSALGG